MYLLIFESIGTSELILIGIVALIFLGPRKLPEIARKMGKIMADLRTTTNEFKETWEREVNFEEEAKALRSAVDDDAVSTGNPTTSEPEGISAPEIKQIDASTFHQNGSPDEVSDDHVENAAAPEDVSGTGLSEKKDWL